MSSSFWSAIRQIWLTKGMTWHAAGPEIGDDAATVIKLLTAASMSMSCSNRAAAAMILSTHNALPLCAGRCQLRRVMLRHESLMSCL